MQHMDDQQHEGMEAIREAFKALGVSHSVALAKLDAALKSGRRPNSKVPHVEAALRNGAVSLVPLDKVAAETLFTLAEMLKQAQRGTLK